MDCGSARSQPLWANEGFFMGAFVISQPLRCFEDERLREGQVTRER
jgi:hypothetical protein